MRKLRQAVSKFLATVSRDRGRKYCTFCGTKVLFFIPHPYFLKSYKLMHELDVVGSDLTNYMCPVCHSHDRERHFKLFVEAHDGDFFKDASILHFAPEKNTPDFILAKGVKEYIKADLFPKLDQIRVDMEDISFPDGKFDIVIANHVLEHVNDYKMAISELSRVLKPGGHLIAQTPLSMKIKNTIEDDGSCGNWLRTKLYGQADHLRLYGQDLYQKICDTGFESLVIEHTALLENIDAKKFGVNAKEPFMLFRRIDK